MLLCSKYILENQPKNHKPVHQNWMHKTTQTITKLIMLKNDFKDKQIYFNEKLYKLCIKQLFTG